MVTLAETARRGGSPFAAGPDGTLRASLWRMGVGGRFALAAGAIALLWSAIALGLS